MKCLSSLLLVIPFTLPASGQVDQDERGLSLQLLRLGPKIGIKASSGSGDIDPDGITAIRAGGFVEIGVSDAFFIQPASLFCQRI
jgi:hypothetical protein